MASQNERERPEGELVHDEKEKQQAEWSYTSGADALTSEEREDEREVISHARPGGLDRVTGEQRLPAEGIGAPEGELRDAFDAMDPHAVSVDDSIDDNPAQHLDDLRC